MTIPPPPPNPPDLLARFLDENDAGCPICAYNLRGSTTASCPECGCVVRLSIATDERRGLPWTIALCLASTTTLIALLVISALARGESLNTRAEQLTAAGSLLLLLCIPALVRRRRRILALSHGARWAITGVVAVVWLLTLVAFASLIVR